MTSDAGLAHLDTYLDQVRRYLKPLRKSEVEEIVAELRSHVLDRVAGQPTPGQVEAAIEALGSPREVARFNMTERVAAEVDEDRSPLTVLRGVGRLAGLSLYGAFAGVVSFTGYALAGALLVSAASKALNRSNVGLWRFREGGDSYSLALGMTSHVRTHQGQELLGWWIIPIGVAAGLILGWLTWRFGLFSVRFMRRSAQRRRT